MKPTELRTKRLILRPFQQTDADDVLAYAADEEWQRYIAILPQPYTRDHAVEFCETETARDWTRDAVFAIEFEGQVIGAVNMTVDARNQVAELGYGIARERWGKGVARQAVGMLLDWAFPTYDLARVFARVDTRTDRLWRLLERLGMTREGLLRSATLTIRGERRDEFVYGLLREEWEGSKT